MGIFLADEAAKVGLDRLSTTGSISESESEVEVESVDFRKDTEFKSVRHLTISARKFLSCESFSSS